VNLNVGGELFVTSRTTLEKCPVLAAVIALAPGSDGQYFLDRDSSQYRYVLNYLRDGAQEFVFPEDALCRSELHREALYLGLEELAKLCLSTVPGPPKPLMPLPTPPAVWPGAAPPSNEEVRLARLAQLNVLHTEDEYRYDSITRIVSALTAAPIVLVSLVAKEYQWFKSTTGIDAKASPRNTSFCAMTFNKELPEDAEMLVIEDARIDERTYGNPLVIGEPYIVFYGGVPLQTSDGFRLGALCSIDRVPRGLSPVQAQIMVNFGTLTVQELERGQLLAGMSEEATNLDGDANGNLNFSVGAFRKQRMREALDEILVLVRADPGLQHWPLLWANNTWIDMVGCRIHPPKRVPGWAKLEWMSGQKRPEGCKQGPSLWDFVQVDQTVVSNLRRDIQDMASTRRPRTLAIAANLLMKPNLAAGLSNATAEVQCRFIPAELPLDMNAAAIKPVPQASPHDPAPLSLFFFLAMRPVPPEPVSPRSSNGKEVGSADGGRSEDGKLRTRGQPALKPPKAPFTDVKLMKLIGSGSFGKVYYGLWFGTAVAVKVLEGGAGKGAAEYEAMISQQLQHPNLVQTFKFSSREKPKDQSLAHVAEINAPEASETWIVQEWCDKGTFSKHFTVPRTSIADLRLVVNSMQEICEAGLYLNSRGVIHGDLTGNNVLLKSHHNTRGFCCKLCDFGLARILEGEEMEILTTQLGTVTHMPPELLMLDADQTKLTSKADVYAAGVLLWQAISGALPFAGLQAPQVVMQVAMGKRLQLAGDVHPKIKSIFEKATEPDPAARPEFDVVLAWLAEADSEFNPEPQK